MQRVPLYGRKGVIRGHALVDDEDAGAVAGARWCLNNGYAYGYAPELGQLLMHRVILGLRPGDGLYVDHINGDGLDNQRANLHVGRQADNLQNLNGGNRGSTSRHRGVSYDRRTRNHTKRWIAQAMVSGRNYFLGRFETEEGASAVAAAFRAEQMPHSKEGRERVD